MLMVNQLIGFGATDPYGALILVDRTSGTTIGNQISGGSLAASYDGDITQTNLLCSRRLETANAYNGKNWGSSKRIGKVVVYGPDNENYTGGGARTVTLTIYGKDGAPSNGTDGASLYSGVIPNSGAGMVATIYSGINLTSTYTCHWCYFSLDSSQEINTAEIEFYEYV